MEPLLFTISEKGYPLLGGIHIPGVKAFTLDAESPDVAELTMKICVRLNPEVRFDRGGDDVGSDGRNCG